MRAAARRFGLCLALCAPGCALFDLEAACADDDGLCPFDRVCNAVGRCMDRAAVDAETGCRVVQAASLSVPKDAARLAARPEECVRLAGALQVQTDAVDLLALSALHVIDGDLFVRETDLVDFAGLDLLVRVGGVLAIRDNPRLESFAGLEALRAVGELDVRDNPRVDANEVAALAAQVGAEGD